MLEEFRGSSIEEIRRRFQWQIPATYNIGADISDAQNFDRVALMHIGDHDAVSRITYGQLARLSNRFANALAALGVSGADRVAVVLPQCPELAISHIAIYKLGAIAVPMTTLFGPDALGYRLRDSGCKVVITNSATHERVFGDLPELPTLEHVLIVERDWAQLIERGSERFSVAHTVADDPALLIYTSGTIGSPKGALHGHRVLLGHLPGFELSHNFYGQPRDRFWTPADWAWIGGLYDALFPVLHHGGTIVSASLRGPFDPEWAIWLMASHGVRNAFLPPTALKMLRLSDEACPPKLKLRSVMSGGEALGSELLEWVQGRFGVLVNEIYGQTECNYVVGNCFEKYQVRPGSMGLAYVGHQVVVLRNGVPSIDTLGEIAVRAPDPVMFLRYWNAPEATKAKFEGDWLLTGDAGVQDAEGYFWFRGRTDDIISSAGYRIGPTEIEECLLRHPAVAMAAAVGAPDAVRGEIVTAFVVLRPGWEASDTLTLEIQTFVRSRLAAYQYPRLLRYVDQMPLTTTGKIRRTELRDQLIAEARDKRDPRAQE